MYAVRRGSSAVPLAREIGSALAKAGYAVMTGGSFWDHFERFVRDAMVGHGTISEEETHVIHRAETAAEVVRLVRNGK
jgi:predicted Rossmann-fold nucleotide-binding protein